MSAPASPIALRKRLDQKVRTFMLGRQLWPESGPLLLAVSGGPDSTALLLILDRLARHRKIELHVAYFDHALRGSSSSAEEASYVEGLCRSLGCHFVRGSGDVRGRARLDQTSIEDAARRERYDFLSRAAAQAGATTVATGHTASDQAETVLMHLIRGAGFDGLAGMAPKALWPLEGADALVLLRPLLCLRRTETLAYCQASEVQPIEDESNESPDHTRNRIRNELLPLLRTFNPRVEDALLRLADASRDVTKVQGNTVPSSGLSRRGSKPAEPQVVRGALAAATGSLKGFSAENVAAIQRLLLHGSTGDGIDLPRGVRASVTRSSVVLQPGLQNAAVLPEGVVRLHPEMPAVLGHLWIRAGKAVIADADAVVEVDAAAASGLVVRRRREGDRFQPLGMQESKKLQDFFVDAHVPREGRDRVPIFLAKQGIIWVGGLRLAEWAKPQEGQPTVWLSYRAAT